MVAVFGLRRVARRDRDPYKGWARSGSWMRVWSCRRTRHDGWCLGVVDQSTMRPRKRAKQFPFVLRIGAVVLGVELGRTPLLSAVLVSGSRLSYAADQVWDGLVNRNWIRVGCRPIASCAQLKLANSTRPNLTLPARGQVWPWVVMMKMFGLDAWLRIGAVVLRWETVTVVYHMFFFFGWEKVRA